ncbi:MAG: FAD-binding oxidoreductase [Gemmatimonadota bacterium]
MSTLAHDLAGVVGDGHVLTDPDLVSGYTTDWTGRYRGEAALVVRPGSAAEVAGVLRCCARHRAPVVTQGGNTGLVGGAVPAGPAAVLLSTRRLTGLGPVDTLAGQVTAGAGVTIADLHAAAAAAGLAYGVDLAARDSATVGGTIATNAGGIHTIRYGPTRAQLLGVEAVLADGSVLSHLSGLAADNTGYDLAGLLTGSEGTLAVITAARLRLWPAAAPAAVALAGVPGLAEAAALLARIRAAVPGLHAAEYLEAEGMDLVRAAAGLPLPLGRGYPAYLLAEVAGDEDTAAGGLAAAGLPDDTAVALDGPGRAALWAYRERQTEAISAAGVPHKLDVSVPVAALAAFREELGPAVRAAAGPACRVIVFGHLGAGNLHVNLLGPGPGEDAADEAVLRLTAAHGGSVSAEHGIGRAKARWLQLSRSPAEIAAMRAIKHALDPAGLLNPGVLLP